MTAIWLHQLIEFWNKLHFSKYEEKDVVVTWSTDSHQIPVRSSMRKSIDTVQYDLEAIMPYFKRHDLGYDDYLKVTRAIRLAELDCESLGYDLKVDFTLSKITLPIKERV